MTRHESVEQRDHHAATRRRATSETGKGVSETPTHPLLHLQRQVGNARVARALAQRVDDQDQPEVGAQGGPISAELSGQIQEQRGGGSALDGGTRATMEAAFGEPFDDVRIHTGAEADGLNRSVSAKAFTTGSDIFFSRDASPSDTRLLAHELTHVVQQRGADTSGPLTVSAAGDHHEQAADAAASAVAVGAAGGVQRLEEEEASPGAVAREAVDDEEEQKMM